MKKIPLTKGQYALVDNQDYELLSQFTWHAKPADKGTIFYAYSSLRTGRGNESAKFSMHNLIIGCSPVDHKDRNGLNNTRGNLRKCTPSQNVSNSYRQYGKSRFKGVSWREPERKWLSRVTKNGKIHNLGYYDTEEAAARAYDIGAVEHFGEFAYLNFPSKQC